MCLLLVQDVVPASQGSVERAALYVVGPMLYSIFASTENRGWWSLDVERSARRALSLERSQWPDCRSPAAEVPCLQVISRVVPCCHGPQAGCMSGCCTTTWKHQSQIQRQTNLQHTMTASNTGPSMPRAILGDFLLEACQRRSSCDADLVAGVEGG